MASTTSLGSATTGHLSTTRYVDCGATSNGNGSATRPWNSLAAANRVRLRPGEELLLRRGTRCVGTLAPHGSGSVRRRAVIGAYGDGKRPVVVGRGTSAVLLRDVSHVVLEDLAISNPGDGTTPRRGVTVVAQHQIVRDVTLRDLLIQHVDGNLTKGPHGSAGIEAAVWDSPTHPLQRFDGLTIERNVVRDVSRSGIRVDGTLDASRPVATQPWPQASHGVVIRRNRLNRIGGDGIVTNGTFGARVERNVVSNGNLQGRGYLNPRGYVCNAGIWAFHANRTRIAHNEVSRMRFNGCDGTGFDVDYDQDGTVVTGNYSHDNAGGFILLCGDTAVRRATVSFNLSIDDHVAISESPCNIAEGKIGTLAGIRMFNNTIVAADPAVSTERAPITLYPGSAGFSFRDNIVAATARRAIPFACGIRCSANLFDNLPAAGTDPVVADPRFTHPSRRGGGRLRVGEGFRLQPGSPAIGAGEVIAHSPHRDYFGDPVPRHARSIGFDEPRRSSPR